MFGNNIAGFRAAIAVAVLSTGALMIQSSARSAGVTAGTNVTNSSAQDEIKALRQQLLVLESRVKELEDKADSVGSSDDAEAKKLDQRLSAIEREQAKLEAADAKEASASDRPEGLTVVAPFMVVDDSGKPIMRVSAAENFDGATFSRGLYVYNADGTSVAHMGPTVNGGRVYVAKPGQLPGGWFAMGPTGAQVQLNNSTTKASAQMGPADLNFRSGGGSVLALFGTRNASKGYLELNDSGGSKMVEAGMLDSHKGYVLANPYRATVDPHGDPSVLKGAGK